jgi:hypothetical protein
MADKKPIDFTQLTTGQVSLELEFYTQVGPGGAIPEGDYKGLFSQLLEKFKDAGVIVISLPSTYVSDAAAITAGGAIGDYYRLSPANIYGFPSDGGIIKRIQS